MVFVDYEFEFKTPQVNVPPTVPTLAQSAFLQQTVAVEYATAAPVIQQYPDTIFDNIGVDDGPEGIVLPPGAYKIESVVCTEVQGAAANDEYFIESFGNEVKYGVPAAVRSATTDDNLNRDDLNWSGWWQSDGVIPFTLTNIMTSPAAARLATVGANIMITKLTSYSNAAIPAA
jgi:hypothetical protein